MVISGTLWSILSVVLYFIYIVYNPFNGDILGLSLISLTMGIFFYGTAFYQKYKLAINKFRKRTN